VVQAQGLELKEGEQIAGVRVVVAYGSATLRGSVNLVNGEPVRGGSFHVRLTKPGVDSPSLRPIQSDARGRFVAEGLPAGLYDIVVSYSGPTMKPRFQKQQVTLTENATTDVTVMFDLSVESPKP
jgi:hypothetical protein